MGFEIEPRELLRYLPSHRVILCIPCTSCVLPNALARHLKDIQRLSQVQRQPYLDTACSLDLAEQHAIFYPDPDCSPVVPELPIFNGLACNAESCPHLCVTEKRMQAHWRLLLRHFQQHTFHTLALCTDRAEQTWRDRVLASCATHSYLRYAVLSITAGHVASQPHRARSVYYAHQAGKYLDKAMQRMSTAVGVTAETLFAILTFCRLMTVCCLAGLQHAESAGTAIACAAATEPAMPKWVASQRQGIAFMWPHRRLIMRDSWQENTPRMLDARSSEPATYPSDPLEARLRALIPLVAARQDPSNMACQAALQELRRLWAATSGGQLSTRDAALLWPVRIPAAYWEAVQLDHPTALVLLSYYCVLWRALEADSWYARGRSRELMVRIRARIDRSYYPWIAWPVKAVLMDVCEIGNEEASPSQHATFDLLGAAAGVTL
ncbi:hypothetical protein LTR53_003973 [Teratosphaeriaceae sp. CCFEE 6253]|nr:hypothetical protein LTR53_003973 [Teratosphaeriaceae sp. CCFEE 6253]